MVAVWLVVFALLGLPPVARGAGTAYVFTGGGDIAQYAIQADGQLSPLSAGIVNTGAGANDMAVTPNGRSAYVAGHQGVIQYDIDPATGALSPKSPALIPRPADDAFPIRHVGVSRRQSAYALAGEPHGGGHVMQYDIDPMTGGLAFKTPLDTGLGDRPEALLISPDGKSAYVTDVNVGHRVSGVRQFDIDPISGQLSKKDPATVSTGPWANEGDLTPGAAALTPDGKNVYVLNFHNFTPNNSIAQLDVDATTGGLSSKNPTAIATGPKAVFIVVTPDGASAYVSSFGPPAIPGPTPDPDGRLDLAVRHRPCDRCADAKESAYRRYGRKPDRQRHYSYGRTAYVTEFRQGVVRLYDVDPESGTLTPKAKSTIATGGSPSQIVLGPLPRVPTAKAQCQRSGWRGFGQFKNQGHCVAFVVRSSH